MMRVERVDYDWQRRWKTIDPENQRPARFWGKMFPNLLEYDFVTVMSDSLIAFT